MHKTIFLMLISALCLLIGTVAASAQELPNDPNVNPDANACYAGGSMEGRCDVDLNHDGVVSDAERNWEWNCAWYVIRFEYGLVSSNTVAQECLGFVQPEAPTPIVLCEDYFEGGYDIYAPGADGIVGEGEFVETVGVDPGYPQCVFTN